MNAHKKLPDSFYKMLIELLSEEKESLSSLRLNLKKQYETLLENRLNDFWQILEEQKALVCEANQKDSLREQRLTEKFFDFKEYSLSDFIHIAPSQYKNKLESLKTDFDCLIEKIEKLRNRNRLMIGKSLEFVQNQMQFFYDLNRTNYSPEGKIESNNYSIFNRQV